MKPMRSRIAALALALVALPAAAGSELEQFLITPACILGMDNARSVAACSRDVPELREQLLAEHAGWKARNAAALTELSRHCEQGLAALYRELRLDAQDIARVERAAEELMASMRAAVDRRTPSQCRNLAGALALHTLTPEDVARSTGIPLTLAFLQKAAPQLLREPPAGVPASYQRARKLHFAQSYARFARLGTGTASLAADCTGATLQDCERAHGEALGPAGELARRERLPPGDEKLTYVGAKMLFRGSFAENQAVGREERIFVLDADGRIKAAWERVQLLEPRFADGESGPLCERYGGSDTAQCRVLSVE